MEPGLERSRRISDALKRCSADLADEPLHADRYEAWRTGLPQPFSVPSALAIAGSKVEFAAVCAALDLDAIGRLPERLPSVPAEPVEPKPTERVWDQALVSEALRRCAVDLEEPPSQESYEVWRAERDDPDVWPSVHVIVRVGWAWQMNLAGLRVASHRRSDTEIWAHVRFVRDQLGDNVTRFEYDRFRTANPELRLVSASTLRVRTGKKWSRLFQRQPQQNG